MDFKQQLDSIILSDNAKSEFYKMYDGELKKWLDDICPEVYACEMQEQLHPWHIYNVLPHMLVSVEAMNKQTKGLDNSVRRMLAYVMFFHDMGKPQCHRRRIKDGQLRDSFYNHNIASEKIASRVLPQLGFNDNEIRIMKKLIYKHDIFMFIKMFDTDNPNWRKLSPEVVEKEVSDLSKVGDGKTLMKYLIMIGRSDNMAQNPKMTGQSLKMLNIMDSMLKKM